MKEPTDLGLNRTGALTSPVDTPLAVQGAKDGIPSSPGDASGIGEERARYAAQAQPLGSVPPPPTLKGMAKTAVKMLQGDKPSVLVDKLGERLAFERTGARLYEAVLSKFDVYPTWAGGPTREELERIQTEELSHVFLVKSALEKLGADPTVQTPSADLMANASMGIPHVLHDPRTNLRECVQALLVAELADNAAWELLIDLADQLGQAEMVERFSEALASEEEHLVTVRSWLETEVLGEASGRGAGKEVETPAPA